MQEDFGARDARGCHLEAVVRLNPSVVALIGVLLCCLFAKIEASARATGEAVPQAQAAASDFVVPVAVSPDQCAANC